MKLHRGFPCSRSPLDLIIAPLRPCSVCCNHGKRSMMYGLFGRSSTRELMPEEVAEGLATAKIMLIDVREPNEAGRERITGALLAPLSQCDPVDLPDPQGRMVVFTCASGVRSIKAAEVAHAAGFAYHAHLAGGVKSWQAAGLPVET